MANKYFYTYIHNSTGKENDSKINENIALAYWNSLVFDVNHRAIWHQGMPFGNVYPGTLSYGEVFNDIDNNVAQGPYAHAEGYNTKAIYDGDDKDDYATDDWEHEAKGGMHAEGDSTTASGLASHAEGASTHSSGTASHAEGNDSVAYGRYSHTEGKGTVTLDDATAAHAEGYETSAEGTASHSEGENTTASGEASHAEGYGAYAGGYASHAEGYWAYAGGYASHAEGNGTTYSDYSHVEGLGSIKDEYSVSSHAENSGTITSSGNAHAEGVSFANRASFAHAEGYGSTVTADSAHAEGISTYATARASHSEGMNTFAQAQGSHAEGSNVKIDVSSQYSHAEGYGSNISISTTSHAEGLFNTIYKSSSSHAEGLSNTIYEASCSHIEGESNACYTYNYSHVEGKWNLSYGLYSHIEGTLNVSYGPYSHLQGSGNVTYGHALVAGSKNIVQKGVTFNAAFGQSNKITTYNDNCIASGSFISLGNYQRNGTEENAHNQAAFGEWLITYNNDEIALGSWNQSYSKGVGTADFYGGNDTYYTIFSLGIGTNSDNRENAIDVRRNGLAVFYKGAFAYDPGDPDNQGCFPKGIYPFVTKQYVDRHDVGLRNWEGTGEAPNYTYNYENAEYFNDYDNNKAVADYAHAEGSFTHAGGPASHAEGYGTVTSNEGEHASGKYNVSTKDETIFSIGGGAGEGQRKNLFEVKNKKQEKGIAFVDGKPIITGISNRDDDVATYIWTGKYSDYISEGGDTGEEYDPHTLYFVEDGDSTDRNDIITRDDIIGLVDTMNGTLDQKMNGVVKSAATLATTSNGILQKIGKSCSMSVTYSYIWTGSNDEYEDLMTYLNDNLFNNPPTNTDDPNYVAYSIAKNMQYIIHM